MHLMHQSHAMLSLRISGFLEEPMNGTCYAQLYVLSRSPSYEPEPPAQHIRRGYSERHDELQLEAIWAVIAIGFARLAWYRTHMICAGGSFPGAIQQPPDPHMHNTCITQRACCLPAAQSAQIGRKRPLQIRVASDRLDARLPSECNLPGGTGAPSISEVADYCQVQAGFFFSERTSTRLVQGGGFIESPDKARLNQPPPVS
jgi:hypothetical protein